MSVPICCWITGTVNFLGQGNWKEAEYSTCSCGKNLLYANLLPWEIFREAKSSYASSEEMKHAPTEN
jgi:hypothetical protein